MNNTVVLYKVQWTASSLNQPYFMSDTARDSYLEDLVQKIVLENVNISLKPNLFLELIIPLDITESESYNYAKIVYNNKTYFANITDYEQISVNRTKLYLERHSLSERTNFLDLFHQFKISQCTLNDYKYGLNANICKQEFRTIRKLLFQDIDYNFVLDYTNSDGRVSPYKTVIKNFYLLYVDNSIFSSVLQIDNFNNNIFGERPQYQLVFFPLEDTTIKYKRWLYDQDSNAWVFRDSEYTFTAITTELLNSLSPYIKAMFFTAIPLGYDGTNYYMPYSYSWFTINNEVIPDVDNFLVFHSDTSDKYSIYIPITKKDLFGKLEFRCYSTSNRYNFDLSDFLVDDATISVMLKYIFNINGSQILFTISGETNSVVNYSQKQFICSLGDSVTFLLDSSASFDAENRYYDALTRNTLKQNLANGLIQSGVQISSGAIQGGVGLATGNPFAVSEGSANAMRGIGSIVTTVLNNKYYKNERLLMAKNERAKPDEVMQGGSSAINIYSQNGNHVFILEEPFEEDYNDFISNLHYYGVETYLFRESILLDELEYENHFFLQATAIIKDNGYIERQIYDDLYSLLSNGCRYFIVDEA